MSSISGRTLGRQEAVNGLLLSILIALRLFDLLNETGSRNAESLADPEEAVKGGRFSISFQKRDIGVVETCSGGKLLLGQSRCLAGFFQFFSKHGKS